MATRTARVLRGLIASSVAVFTAALAHAAGGGILPGAGVMSLAFAFSTLACIALAGRRLSRIRLAISVILSQALFHLLFAMTGVTTVMTPAQHGTMAGSMAQMMAEPVALPSSVVADPAMPESGWMLVAHGFGALVTIAALFWGERTFWALCDATVFALVKRLSTPPHGQPRLRLPIEFASDARRADFLRAGLRHRGPPVGNAASA
jgi:hypothetical protein